MPAASRDRSCIKSRSRFEWKDTLRKECFTRLDAERARLLSRVREARSVTYVDEKAAVQEAIRSIINTSAECVHARTVDTTRSEEFRTENGPSENYPAAVQATSLSAEQRRMGDSSAAASLSPLSSHDFEQLAPEEFIELMQSLEESLYQDALREEAEYLDAFERQDVENTVEAHFTQLALGGSEEDSVLCPLCGTGKLVQHRGVVLCTNRDFRLDVGIEGIGLPELKAKLALSLDEHCQGECNSVPDFTQCSVGGVNALVLKCESCDCFEVIV